MGPPLAQKPVRRGSGARGGGKEFVSRTVRAKRAASAPEVIKKKIEEGIDPEDLPPRGFIRLGKMNTRIMTGQEDLSDWDLEELRRGQRRDKGGKWRGRAPSVVPKQLHDEAIKRTFEDAQRIMREGLVPAVEYLAGIVQDDNAEDKDRLKAVQMLLDRVLGKPLERVEVTGESSPWQDAIVSAVVPIVEVEEVIQLDNQ